jgi:hypothetical protein
MNPLKAFDWAIIRRVADRMMRAMDMTSSASP